MLESVINMFTGYYEAGILVMNFAKSLKFNIKSRLLLDITSVIIVILVLD